MQQLTVSNTLILEAPGVDLTPYNKILVGAVLDLFEGKPTLQHLSLWNPDATFVDPITTAQGYNRYAAQWYALAQVLGPVKIQSHEVVSSGSPIEVKLHNRYTLPPINKTQDIHSLVKIWVDGNGKIARVEDRWDGELPDGALNEAFRKAFAMTIPVIVKVPRTEEEDIQMRAILEGFQNKKDITIL
ncbi:hypothetical protein NEUTE2DRAFT_78059 [Neurospora tetrasperma FGSC 2509]|nr:hypothetical protein NEUTE2DRAFT_78059 [Neurospora tetrasperma FGSC 2509]